MGIAEVRDKEIEYCGKNLVYFVENYGHYEDKDADELVQPFRLWNEQKEALIDFENHRLNIVLKARQLGFTWLAINYAARLMLCKPGRTVLGMSRSEDEAKELIRRMCVVLRAMPELIKEKPVSAEWQKSSPWFESTALSVTIHRFGRPDSVMQCFASSSDAGRSFTADLFIIDEWAAQANARDIWGSIFPTINRPTGGQLIGISTNQRGTLFEELWQGENAFYKVFIPWYADPKRTQEWYDETKKTIGDVLMAQEYPATAEEAMSTPGGAFFPEVVDSSILTREPLKGDTVTYFAMDYGLDMLAGYFFNRDAYGNFQIVAEIFQSNLNVGMAADTIKSVAKEFNVVQYLAPSDLFSRNVQTGKSTAIMFGEYGINLISVNRDREAGCLALKELLRHGDGQLGRLTILDNCAPNLLRCLKKIQHDEKHPNVYETKKSHELTHAVDAARYMAVYWTNPANGEVKGRKKKWRRDQYEDYENASEEDKRYLIELWGEPL